MLIGYNVYAKSEIHITVRRILLFKFVLFKAFLVVMRIIISKGVAFNAIKSVM